MRVELVKAMPLVVRLMPLILALLLLVTSVAESGGPRMPPDFDPF